MTLYCDTARVYDLVQSSRHRDADTEADLVAAEARRRTPAARTLLDVACGTGVSRSERHGRVTRVHMRYVVASLDEVTTMDEHHVLRLSDPEEFARAYADAGLTFERLPHMLHAGRSVYVGVEPPGV